MFVMLVFFLTRATLRQTKNKNGDGYPLHDFFRLIFLEHIKQAQNLNRHFLTFKRIFGNASDTDPYKQKHQKEKFSLYSKALPFETMTRFPSSPHRPTLFYSLKAFRIESPIYHWLEKLDSPNMSKTEIGVNRYPC